MSKQAREIKNTNKARQAVDEILRSSLEKILEENDARTDKDDDQDLQSE